MDNFQSLIDTAVEALRRLDKTTALQAIEGALRELDRYAAENEAVFQVSGERAVKQCADTRLAMAFQAAGAGREPMLAIQLLEEAGELVRTPTFWSLSLI